MARHGCEIALEDGTGAMPLAERVVEGRDPDWNVACRVSRHALHGVAARRAGRAVRAERSWPRRYLAEAALVVASLERCAEHAECDADEVGGVVLSERPGEGKLL